MPKLARWSTTHRKYVLLGWVLLLSTARAAARPGLEIELGGAAIDETRNEGARR